MIVKLKEDEHGKYFDADEVLQGLFKAKDQKRIKFYEMDIDYKGVIAMTFYDKNEKLIKPKGSK
jgi:hypothetical protein